MVVAGTSLSLNLSGAVLKTQRTQAQVSALSDVPGFAQR